LSIFCLLAVRDEERFLPGFLDHIRDHVDGILALDDGSTDRTAEILRGEPRVISVLREERTERPHANEARNRYRLLVEARRMNARWILCGDADERFEAAFLRRLRAEAEKGDRDGRPVRDVRIVNLWNSHRHYRVDGLCGPRWAPRLFRLPHRFTQRPSRMHLPWFPPQLDKAPRARVNAYLYHLRMIDPCDRDARLAKFRAVDPRNEHQSVGYGHLVDETGLRVKPILPWRRYADLAAGPAGLPAELPEAPAFDELFYLNVNLDVRRAVAQGRFATGWEHFVRYGAWTGRRWRRKAALAGLDFASIFADWRARKA
jgi:hypothetical protein